MIGTPNPAEERDGGGGVRRLLLVRHAPTHATRTFAFPADEPLLDDGPLELPVPPRCEVICSPSLRCAQTAAAAGLTVDAVEPRIAECDFGAWTGRTLAEVEPADSRLWMTDPDAAPHGGESLRTFAARVAAWLDEQARLSGAAVAITHGGVVKAAVIHALNAPVESFWRIDASPLAITELHAHNGRWTVTRANAALRHGGAPAGATTRAAALAEKSPPATPREAAAGRGDLAAARSDDAGADAAPPEAA
jgi:broad specificity phosphatase PhoE